MGRSVGEKCSRASCNSSELAKTVTRRESMVGITSSLVGGSGTVAVQHLAGRQPASRIRSVSPPWASHCGERVAELMGMQALDSDLLAATQKDLL